MSRRRTARRKAILQARRAGHEMDVILPHPNHARDDCHTMVKRRGPKGEISFNSPLAGSRRGTNPITEHAMSLWAKDWKEIK